MDKNLVRALALSTQSVFKDLVGWDMKVDQIVVKKGGKKDTSELNAIISFNGKMSGAFVFLCTEALAASIAGAVLGMECETGSDDTKDAIGELLNMIVGAVKNHYQSQSDPFSISVPTIVAGTDFSVHVKVQSDDEVVSLAFQHVGGPERVGVNLMLSS